MSTLAKVGLLVAVIVTGPVMFVYSRGNALAAGFRKVNVGDPAATVTTKMGPPQVETHEHLYLHGDTELHYSVWPVPQLWVVSLKDGKVVEKAEMQSP